MNAINDLVRLNRSEGIGGSDAARIINGNWHELYLEKVGLREPDDLSDVFPVQLGILTERFHIEWQARRHNLTITYPEVRYYHATNAFMFTHLDGWINDRNTFIEAKHSNSRATLREKAAYYMPQLQHAIAVTGTDNCYFSLIAGNEEPDWCIVDRDEAYITRLIEMEASFWWHVENRVPPEITPSGTQAEMKRLGSTIRIDGLKPYDMSTHNEWCAYAPDYIATRDAAEIHEKAKRALKELVPADASECVGAGVTIKRDKRGTLRFS